MKPVPIFDVAEEGGTFVLRRDRAPLRTPAGAVYALPTQALAEAVAAEWRAQGDKPDPARMPLTQLASTALDIVGKKRDEIVASLAAYAGSDMLCHRAHHPPELAARQTDIWLPWLVWAEEKYGAALLAAQGIMPILQPQKSLTALRDTVAAYDTFFLTGLQQAVGVSGSLVLGLALAEGQVTAEGVFKAAELESLFQAEQWGEDPVTAERHKSVRKELEDCARWFALLAL